jgi:tetratricopeptide (TPR) repeat protein
MTLVKRRRIVVDDSALAGRIGERLKAARKQAGLTQQQLAEGRYTKAYVSALEKGIAKPSMAALNFFADRLGLPASSFLVAAAPVWTRLEADVFLASGDYHRAADAFEELLPVVGGGVARAEILRGLAEARCRLDRGAEAIAPATEAAEFFERARRPRDWALASYWLSYAMLLAGNVAEARSILTVVLERVREGLLVEADFKVRVLGAFAAIANIEVDYHAALGYLEEARAVAVDLDTRRRGGILLNLASTYRELGDMEAAIRLGTESLALMRAAQASTETAILENDLALAYLAVGNLTRARELAIASDDVARREVGDHFRAHVTETRAQIALASGDPDEALELLRECETLAEATGNGKAFTSMLVTRARAYVELGRFDDAVAAYRDAAELVRANGPRGRLPKVLGEWADTLARLGRHEEAYALNREALQGS